MTKRLVAAVAAALGRNPATAPVGARFEYSLARLGGPLRFRAVRGSRPGFAAGPGTTTGMRDVPGSG